MDRSGLFAGDDPFAIARRWLAEAETSEPNDPNAIALATADADGLPNVRMVLLKEIEDAAFVFYTNYGSAKATEIAATGKAAFVMHWKSLRRQVRVRGLVTREEGPQADASAWQDAHLWESGSGGNRHRDFSLLPWQACSASSYSACSSFTGRSACRSSMPSISSPPPSPL